MAQDTVFSDTQLESCLMHQVQFIYHKLFSWFLSLSNVALSHTVHMGVPQGDWMC